ncbi:hypothetical protein [Bradyrhizobium sp. RDT46]|uniref:hypothetical protein n=1 Tax=Bradyrhizobium sp. RDT46 TaxID=3341829 RepID=UPI0035C6A470
MEQTQRVRPDDAIAIGLQIRVEAAVIHAVAEDGAVVVDGDDAATILDNLRKVVVGERLCLQIFQQPLAQQGACAEAEDENRNGKIAKTISLLPWGKRNQCKCGHRAADEQHRCDLSDSR